MSVRSDRPSYLGLVAAAISFAVAAYYMVAVRPDLQLDALETAALSVFLGLLGFGGLALAGALIEDRERGGSLLLAAGLGLLVLGLMGLLSIGPPLLVAGVMALVDGFRLRPKRGL